MSEDKKEMDPKFAKFHGVDREEIQWNPVIDELKCVGCGVCVTSCSRGVYAFDYENKKSKVVKPNNCMVACITCSNLCPAAAINFVEEGDTPRKKAQRIVKDFQMISKVKNELEQRKADLDINKKIDQEQ